MKRRAAAIAAAAVVVLASAAHNTRDPQPQAGRGVVDKPAAPAPPRAPVAEPPAIEPARAALRWQLAAEHGQRRPIPTGVFTEPLTAELSHRPPAAAPGQPLARIVRLRELKSTAGLRQIVATIRSGAHIEYVNVLLDCEQRCKVASIQ